VDVVDVANVSEVHASIFRAKACKMGVFPCTEVHGPTFIQNKHGEVEGESGSLSGPVRKIMQQATGCTKKSVAFDVPE
jgi:hypothetical protein